MLNLLAKIIPLDLAATLSPGILALSIILLGSKSHPRSRTFAMLIGNTVIAVLIAIIGFTIGNNITTESTPTSINAAIELIFGLFFIFFGIKIFFSKERKVNPKESERPQFLKWFVVGVLISATNFDAVFLSLAAAKEVGDATINYFDKLLILAVNCLFFILPVLLPLLVYLLFPKFAYAFLEKINSIVLKYSRYVLSLMFSVFGLYFILKGILILW